MTSAVQPGTFLEAEAEFFCGRFREARRLYAETVLDGVSGQTTVGLAVLVALERLADIATLYGETSQAEQYLERAAEGFLAGGNNFYFNYIALKRSQIAAGCGALSKAETLLQNLRGLPVVTNCEPATGEWESQWTLPDSSGGDRTLFFAQYYLTGGRLTAAQGQYRSAIRILERGIWHAQQPGAQGAMLPLALALAAARLEEGDLLTAGSALTQIAAAGIDTARQPGYGVEFLETSARLDSLRGNLGAAKKALEDVVGICHRGGFERGRMFASLNLAYALLFMNQTREAARLASEARRLSFSLRDSEAERSAQLLIYLAHERGQALVAGMPLAPSVTTAWRGDQDPSPQRSRTAPAFRSPSELPPSSNYLTLFEQRALGFFILAGRAEWSAAREYLRQMDEAFLGTLPPTDSVLIHTRLAALDCMLACYEGRFDLATECLERTAGALRTMDLKPELVQLLRFLEWAYQRAGRPHDASRAGYEIKKIDDHIANSLAGSDRVLYLLGRWTGPERYMAAELAQLEAIKSGLLKASRPARLLRRWAITRRLAQVLDYTDRFKGDLAGRETELTAVKAKPALHIFRRLLRHPRHAATVSFIVLPDHIAIVTATWLKLDFDVLPVTRGQLRDWVRQYHEASREIAAILHNSAYAAAGRWRYLRTAVAARRSAERGLVAALGLDKVLGALPGRIRSIVFVPDDVLHGVPFAALPQPRTSRRLVRDFAVSIAYEWGMRPRRTCGSKDAVSVAIPDAPGLPPLPGARAEKEIVTSWIQDRGLVPQPVSTTCESIRRHLEGAAFFHAACHGVFAPDRPDESGLLLLSGSGDPETLTLRQLARLNLEVMEQAVLSSCWSADSFVLPGRWVVSLPETLWRAGCRSVLGSLWEVDDELAPHFLKTFLQALGSGASRDQAIQAAQLNCLRRGARAGGRSFRDPVFWATFQIYGDPGRIAL